MWSNFQIVDNKYPQGKCLPIFADEEICGLFSQLLIFLNQTLNVGVNFIGHFFQLCLLIKFYYHTFF